MMRMAIMKRIKINKFKVLCPSIIFSMFMITGCSSDDYYSSSFWSGASEAYVKTKLHNADVLNKRSDFGETPFIYAIIFNSNPNLISVLIDLGADVNVCDDTGDSPLMYAAYYNTNPDIVSLLIESGADVNHKNSSGETVLHHSLQNENCLAIIKALVRGGADLNVLNNQGFSPLVYALQQIELQQTMEKELSVKNAASLHRNFSEIIVYMVKNGAKMSYFQSFGNSPIEFACANNDTETLTLLVDLGVDLNSTDLGGKTPLMYAALQNANTNIITTLMGLGADPEVKDAFGKTVFDYLREREGKFRVSQP